MAERDSALFSRRGDWFHPSGLTRGPWRPDAQNGGPPAALFGLAIGEEVGHAERVARINVELESPVPLEPLRVDVTRRQVSRRVAHLDLSLVTSERQVASARALLLAAQELPEPEWVPPDEDYSVPGPEKRYMLGEPPGSDELRMFHRDATEHRVLSGGYGVPGPGTAWIRLSHPLVEGEETTPLGGLMAASDFGSALSRPLPADSRVGLINVDISLALVRHPVGEWFRLEASGLVDRHGIGLAVANISDTQGPLGIVHLSQLGQASPR